MGDHIIADLVHRASLVPVEATQEATPGADLPLSKSHEELAEQIAHSLVEKAIQHSSNALRASFARTDDGIRVSEVVAEAAPEGTLTWSSGQDAIVKILEVICFSVLGWLHSSSFTFDHLFMMR